MSPYHFVCQLSLRVVSLPLADRGLAALPGLTYCRLSAGPVSRWQCRCAHRDLMMVVEGFDVLK